MKNALRHRSGSTMNWTFFILWSDPGRAIFFSYIPITQWKNLLNIACRIPKFSRTHPGSKGVRKINDLFNTCFMVMFAVLIIIFLSIVIHILLGKKKANPKTFICLDEPVLTLLWTRRWFMFFNISYYEIFCFRFFSQRYSQVKVHHQYQWNPPPPPPPLSTTLAENFATDTVNVIDATGASDTGWKFAAGVMYNLTLSY